MINIERRKKIDRGKGLDGKTERRVKKKTERWSKKMSKREENVCLIFPNLRSFYFDVFAEIFFSTLVELFKQTTPFR